MLFFLLIVGLTAGWGCLVSRMSAPSIQSQVDSFITLEVTLLAVLIAGLAITITLAATQARRLDLLKRRLIRELRSPNGDYKRLLKEKADAAEAKLKARESVSSFHSKRVKGIRHIDVPSNYRNLASVADDQSLEGYEFASNSLELFRAATSALMSDTWLDSQDPINPLAQAINELDQRNQVVAIVNRTYDMRTAARRGLPIFCFALCLTLVVTVIAGCINADHLAQEWFVRSVTFPIIPLAYFIGVYSYRIPVLYMRS